MNDILEWIFAAGGVLVWGLRLEGKQKSSDILNDERDKNNAKARAELQRQISDLKERQDSLDEDMRNQLRELVAQFGRMEGKIEVLIDRLSK